MRGRSLRSAGLWIAGAAAAVLLAAFLGSFAQARREADAAQVAAVKAAHVETLAWPVDFQRAGGDIAPDFGAAEGPGVAMRVGAQVLTASSEAPALRPVRISGDPPSSLALDRSGDMLGVAGGYLGALDETDRFSQALPLPYPEMRVAASSDPGVLFLFGGRDGDFRLYGLLDDGRIQVLLQSNQPLVGAAGGRAAVYAATATAILEVEAGRPTVLFRTPPDFAGPITSLAVGRDGLVFFATAARVYALLGPNAVSIVNDAGGSIRTAGSALYVLDPNRRLLVRLTPATAQLVSPEAG